MRHVHFVQALDTKLGGGLAPAALGLHRGLVSIGQSSTLITTGARTHVHSRDGIHEFRRLGPPKSFFTLSLMSSAVELLEESDVLHGHGFYTYLNAALPPRARQMGVPLVYHPHGMLEPLALARSRRRKRLARALFEHRNFRRAVLWRALTVREADQIRALGVEAPVVVLPNGIDLAEFGPVRFPDMGRSFRQVLFLGRLHPIKGLDLLLRAWRLLEPARGDWRLVIAGPDEKGYGAQIRKLAADLGLSASVSFTGEVAKAERVPLMQASDLVVVPSYSEGFPVVMLEALAGGRAVIATNAASIDGLQERGAGVVSPATPESLAGALRTAIDLSDADRCAMGTKGRAWVEADFSWPKLARSLDEACAAL